MTGWLQETCDVLLSFLRFGLILIFNSLHLCLFSHVFKTTGAFFEWVVFFGERNKTFFVSIIMRVSRRVGGEV